MKKFMKGAAITAGIFFLVGLIVMIIGIGCGGIQDIRQKSMDELNRVIEKFEGIKLMDGVNISFGLGDFNTDLFFEDEETYTNGKYTIEDSAASDLEIVVGVGDLRIKYHDEPFVGLELGELDKMQCYVKDDTLKITAGLVAGISANSSMTVYLPADKRYNNILIDVDAGNLEAEKLLGEEIDINVAAGQCIVDEIDTYSLNVEVGMGNVEIEGQVNQEIIVDCGMGQIIMELDGKGKDFNYELDCGLGSLSVENIYTIAGIGDVELNNNASKDMEISVGMGAVNVTFEE